MTQCVRQQDARFECQYLNHDLVKAPENVRDPLFWVGNATYVLYTLFRLDRDFLGFLPRNRQVRLMLLISNRRGLAEWRLLGYGVPLSA